MLKARSCSGFDVAFSGILWVEVLGEGFSHKIFSLAAAGNHKLSYILKRLRAKGAVCERLKKHQKSPNRLLRKSPSGWTLSVRQLPLLPNEA